MSKNNLDKRMDNVEIYPDVSSEAIDSCPETATEMVNSYGTYNIQPTADTDNDFPAIAQGENRVMKSRSLHFFRDGDDENPASGGSDARCIDT